MDQSQHTSTNTNAERKPGRPRLLDDTKRREVVALITAGCDMVTAAKYVGCAPSTVRRNADRDPEFSSAIARAYTAAQIAPLNALRQAATTHWRAAAWFLERVNPQCFAKQNVTLLKPEQVSECIDIMARIVAAEVKDDDLKRRIARRFRKFSKQMGREAFLNQNSADAWQPRPSRWPRGETLPENFDELRRPPRQDNAQDSE